MSDLRNADELAPSPDIGPFSLDPSQTYTSGFIENLRAYYFNALPRSREFQLFGPLYEAETSQGAQLRIFSMYTDAAPPEIAADPGVISRRWILLLSATSSGRIAGFRTTTVDEFERNAEFPLQTAGYIETSDTGHGHMMPLELAMRDILTRLATRAGKPLRQTIYNGNLEDLHILEHGTGNGTPDPDVVGLIKEKRTEQDRWMSVHKRLGFELLPGYYMKYDIHPSVNGLYMTDPTSLSCVRLARKQTPDGKIDAAVVSQSSGDPEKIRQFRLREYESLIHPMLGGLCYPEED